MKLNKQAKEAIERMKHVYAKRLEIETHLREFSVTSAERTGHKNPTLHHIARLHQGKMTVLERIIEDLNFLLNIQMSEDGYVWQADEQPLIEKP